MAKGRSLTAEEREKLRQLWGTMPDAEVASALGRSISSARLMAGRLGLRGRRRGYHVMWTDDEIQILETNAGRLGIAQLMELLPGRSRAAIESKVRLIGPPMRELAFCAADVRRATGCDGRQVRAEIRKLRPQPKQYGVRKYLLTPEQFKLLCDRLTEPRPKRWARAWSCCRSCGTNARTSLGKHAGHGLCQRCRDLERYLRNQNLAGP